MSCEKLMDVIRTILNITGGDEVQKILLQKTVYYLETCGIDLGYAFSGYKFGPFSVDIMNDADELESQGKIIVSRYKYKLIDHEGQENQPNQEMQNNTEFFIKKILDENDEFENIELFGTVLYVAKNIDYDNEEDRKNRVLEGVKKWKLEKYSDDQINKSYDKLLELEAI